MRSFQILCAVPYPLTTFFVIGRFLSLDFVPSAALFITSIVSSFITALEIRKEMIIYELFPIEYRAYFMLCQYIVRVVVMFTPHLILAQFCLACA